MRLKDKKAFITGGSRGIGKTVATFFLKEGARVGLIARSKEELAEAKKELVKISPYVEVFAADVSDAGQVKAAVAGLRKSLGGCDVLVNAAGIYGPIGPSASVDA